MIDCMNIIDFVLFTSLLQGIIEIISIKTIVLHTISNGDVYWTFDEIKGAFCAIKQLGV